MIHELLHPMRTIADVLEAFGLWYVGSRAVRVYRKSGQRGTEMDDKPDYVYELGHDVAESHVVVGELLGWRVYQIPPAEAVDIVRTVMTEDMPQYSEHWDSLGVDYGRMYSPTRHDQIESALLVAECENANHRPGSNGCGCGIHGYASLDDLLTKEKEYCKNPEESVIALCKGWGTITLRDFGWRAQFVQLVALYTDAPTQAGALKADIPQLLRDHYDLPVFPRSELDNENLPARVLAKIDLRAQAVSRQEVPAEDLRKYLNP